MNDYAAHRTLQRAAEHRDHMDRTRVAFDAALAAGRAALDSGDFATAEKHAREARRLAGNDTPMREHADAFFGAVELAQGIDRSEDAPAPIHFFDSHGALWQTCAASDKGAEPFGPRHIARHVDAASAGLDVQPGESPYAAAERAGRLIAATDDCEWDVLADRA